MTITGYNLPIKHQNLGEIMKTIAALIIGLLLTSCMSMGTQVDPVQANRFTAGVTTENEVIAALGEPNQVSTKSDGTREIGYMHATATPDPKLFIPFVGAFIGKVDAKSTTVIFAFDENGKLKETKSNTATVSGGAFGYDVK